MRKAAIAILSRMVIDPLSEESGKFVHYTIGWHSHWHVEAVLLPHLVRRVSSFQT